jgi:3-hydroxyacyl-CoA dehydrogenase
VARASAADWIVEAVVEDLEVKRELLARLEAHVGPHAVVSSNTSGIPLTALAEGRSPDFQRRWLGTHFFNPPRYLSLVEVIPTAGTDPEVVEAVSSFLDVRLGKGVVIVRDSPGFVGNRIGVFAVVRILQELASGAFTVEEIDALTGPVIGRPKSATCRTLDLAGLDILAAVAADLRRRLPGDPPGAFELPPLVDRMVAAGQIGVKTGRGFYTRDRTDAESPILAIDPKTLAYRPLAPVSIPGLEPGRAPQTTDARVRALFLSEGRAGEFLRRTLGATLLYAAQVAPAIADTIDDVDRAMRWGFGWQLGPFDTWDAIGIRAVLDACAAEPPPIVRDRIEGGRDRFRDAPAPPAGPGRLILQSARARAPVVRQNAGASLVDLGDGVLCVEFHSKLNTIGGDTIAMLHAGVEEAAANFTALVVGSEAENFSAGANLRLLLIEAQEGNWDEIDLMVRAFQGAAMALKTAPVPVIAAPAGLALGGGAEICLHADRVQAAGETYLGLVEVGVGLIPAGGGTKEMLLRATGDGPRAADTSGEIQAAFETIGFARVSASGPDARRLGYLRDVDGVSMNRERVIADAKTRALARVAEGYVPPRRRTGIPVGGAGTMAALSLGVHLAWRAGRISAHDALIGRKLAWVLAGGDIPHATTTSEEALLDLEREAFLSLVGEPKTLERIGYTLKTGKVLRN